MFGLYLASIVLHLLAASAWLGGMIFLVVVALPALRSRVGAAAYPEVLDGVVRRFRAVGWASFVVLAATGVAQLGFRGYVAVDLLDGRLFAGSFGRLLAAKLGLFAAVVVLAAVHDFRIGPRAVSRLRAGDASPGARRDRATAAWIGRIELVLALAIVAAAVAMVRGVP